MYDILNTISIINISEIASASELIDLTEVNLG